jgi:hypothetical protein
MRLRAAALSTAVVCTAATPAAATGYALPAV